MGAAPRAAAVSAIDSDRPEPVGHTLTMIMVAVAFAGLSAACGLSYWLHQKPAGDGAEATLTRTLLGRQMVIPISWFRGTPDRQQGFSSEIDLRISVALGPGGAEAPVDVTLLPQSQVRTSANLLDGVYLHQFMPNELAGPPGLIGKPLYATEGFEGETVWYDALSQNPFVVKCGAAPGDNGPAQCLRTVALMGGIAAVYAFPANLLDRWKEFDPAMRAALTRIGAL